MKNKNELVNQAVFNVAQPMIDDINKSTIRPDGLWPITEMILNEIEASGYIVPKIEAHDPCDADGSDFIWGKLTPALELSEGEYMTVSRNFDDFSTNFGIRAIFGGDPTWDGTHFIKPSKDNAKLIASDFFEYFTKK